MSIKKITEKVIKIPSEDLEMEVFVNDNREKLTNHILDRIGYAIDNNMDCVELFNFGKTEYYVILYEKDYTQTLEHIFSYFLENEIYESCQKAKNIKDKMINFVRNVKTTYN
jgi:hypothetical protein